MSSLQFSDPRFSEIRIIDSHVHVFPDLVRSGVSLAEQLTQTIGLESIGSSLEQYREKIQSARSSIRGIRDWIMPALHDTQVGVRILPSGVRKWVDELSAGTPLPGLLVESTAEDLLESMQHLGIARALVIPHPPLMPSPRVYEITQSHEQLLPVIHVGKDSSTVTQDIEEGVSHGAVAIKLHPASDGLGPDSVHYRDILDLADQHELPVILHTGCFHTHVLYRGPEFGDPTQFESWFSEFPRVNFILAHMNMHEPDVAIDLASRFENLWLETSWQPAEAIGEAVRRVGAERVLFGTDWPLLGSNQGIGLQRIAQALDANFLTWEDTQKILASNSMQLFKIEV